MICITVRLPSKCLQKVSNSGFYYVLLLLLFPFFIYVTVVYDLYLYIAK